VIPQTIIIELAQQPIETDLPVIKPIEKVIDKDTISKSIILKPKINHKNNIHFVIQLNIIIF
jgi:hypothetical protein